MANYGKIQLTGVSQPDSASKKKVTFKWTGEDGVERPLEAFASQEQMLHVMSDRNPETGKAYCDEDAAVRNEVKRLIANTANVPGVSTLGQRRSVVPDNATFLKGLKRDALIQRRNELVERAGGNDAIAKLELAEALMNPAFAEAAYEMEAATEVPTPYADLLRQRKERGEGPLQWT